MKLDLDKKQIYSVKSFLAFVLRHKPFFYKIKLDSDGKASIDNVLNALNTAKKMTLTKDQLIEIAKRFSGGIFHVDVKENKIGAKSGHSILFNMKVPDGFIETKEVPKQLFCSVIQNDIANMIETGGITFANRQVVLMPQQMPHKEGMSGLTINSSKAKSDSVKFYFNEEKDAYFTRHLSSKYVSLHV